jgi:hypothetical protein
VLRIATIWALASRGPADPLLGLHSNKQPHPMANLIRPLPFLLFMGCTLAVGLLSPSTDSALARCENRGGSVAECRLLVLGR